jgi:hypothetical protein
LLERLQNRLQAKDLDPQTRKSRLGGRARATVVEPLALECIFCETQSLGQLLGHLVELLVGGVGRAAEALLSGLGLLCESGAKRSL